MDRILARILSRLAGATADATGPSPLVSRDEAEAMATLPASSNLDLFAIAGTVRTARAPAFFRCGIVNAKSGLCPEDCAFCAQSARHKTGVAVYPLLDDTALLNRARLAHDHGAQRFGIVTSGTALPEKDVDALCAAIERIRKEVGIGICGSLGMLTPERARRLRDAGMTRYHHNLETAESHFPRICTSHSYTQDKESILAAQDAGMETCCGGIFGLGESPLQRVEMAFTIAELNVTSIPLNLLIAVPGTRLEGQPKLRPDEALRAIALFRIVNPDRDILIAGGREHVLGAWQSWLYAAGANGLMVGDYLTASGSELENDETMLRTLGLA